MARLVPPARFVPLICVLVYTAVYFIGQFVGFEIGSSVHIGLLAILSVPYFLGVFRFTYQVWCGVMVLLAVMSTPSLFYLVANQDLFVGGGLLSLMILGVLFSGYLSHAAGHDLRALVRTVDIIFQINIIYIALETLFLLLGGWDVLADHIDSYRLITGQPIYSILSMDSPGSPLGLKVGPQYASQIIMLGIFWFFPVVELPGCGRVMRKFWFLIALALYPFCMTGTSLLMGLVMLAVVLFVFPNAILVPYIARWRLAFSVAYAIFMMLVGWSLPGYRVSESASVSFHLRVFLDPIYAFQGLTLTQKIFGMKGDVGLISYTDFAFGAILWNSGSLLVFVFLASMSAIIFRSLMMARRGLNGGQRVDVLYPIMCLLAVQIVGWLLSLGHYPVAVENVGKLFFALIIGGSVSLLHKAGRHRLMVSKAAVSETDFSPFAFSSKRPC